MVPIATWSVVEPATGPPVPSIARGSVMQRRRVKQALSIEKRLTEQAEADRERAKLLPPGVAREELLREARRTETASHLTEWLNSPGLRPPK